MSWDDMSPEAMKRQLHAIADATDLQACVLRSALTNLDAIAMELGEAIGGSHQFSLGNSALSNLRTAVHNWLNHAIADADAAVEAIRDSCHDV